MGTKYTKKSYNVSDLETVMEEISYRKAKGTTTYIIDWLYRNMKEEISKGVYGPDRPKSPDYVRTRNFIDALNKTKTTRFGNRFSASLYFDGDVMTHRISTNTWSTHNAQRASSRWGYAKFSEISMEDFVTWMDKGFDNSAYGVSRPRLDFIKHANRAVEKYKKEAAKQSMSDVIDNLGRMDISIPGIGRDKLPSKRKTKANYSEEDDDGGWGE